MAEQETSIELLKAELDKKHEQLGFITDEKVTNNSLFASNIYGFWFICCRGEESSGVWGRSIRKNL